MDPIYLQASLKVREGVRRDSKRDTTKDEQRDAALLTLKMAEGDQLPRNVGSLYKLEKVRKHSPLEPAEQNATLLISSLDCFSLVRPLSDF